MTRLDRLKEAWHLHNREDFGGVLEEPHFSVRRRERTVDGAFVYTNTGRNKRLMVHTDVFKDEKKFLGTLLHEMVHQWELEVLGICPKGCDHKGQFAEKALDLEKKYGVPII